MHYLKWALVLTFYVLLQQVWYSIGSLTKRLLISLYEYHPKEIPIFTENGITEISSIFILLACSLRCAQYAVQSRVQQGRYFWLAAVLVFFMVIRRELNYLADLLVPKDFLLLGYSYDRWEDGVLLVIYLIILGLLIYAWRYCWAVLKSTALALYIVVAALALLQYMGENAIVFPSMLGGMVEEITEDIIYLIALIYLWNFKLAYFEAQLGHKLNVEEKTP